MMRLVENTWILLNTHHQPTKDLLQLPKYVMSEEAKMGVEVSLSRIKDEMWLTEVRGR